MYNAVILIASRVQFLAQTTYYKCSFLGLQLEHELHVSREKSAVLFDDRSKFEDSVKAFQQSSSVAQSQVGQLQV